MGNLTSRTDTKKKLSDLYFFSPFCPKKCLKCVHRGLQLFEVCSRPNLFIYIVLKELDKVWKFYLLYIDVFDSPGAHRHPFMFRSMERDGGWGASWRQLYRQLIITKNKGRCNLSNRTTCSTGPLSNRATCLTAVSLFGAAFPFI